eukprot:CAMPEP_0114527548 /NCGR_PEP_ID=MMETSP0109-20121206/23682_1 /TAXON_ID=29199 /ORGANISM="Chlorarachnion reptans, Strain CCCM449" /LENGTH=74 /DNA_ID=CAMNT_0001709535 /DNA_START=1 /DNA_END=222 /DNA_ORIENTATION=-
MGVPIHMFFTMPWSPTSSFPHPLGGVVYDELKQVRDKDESGKVGGFLDNYFAYQGTDPKSSYQDRNVYSYKAVD